MRTTSKTTIRSQAALGGRSAPEQGFQRQRERKQVEVEEGVRDGKGSLVVAVLGWEDLSRGPTEDLDTNRRDARSPRAV